MSAEKPSYDELAALVVELSAQLAETKAQLERANARIAELYISVLLMSARPSGQSPAELAVRRFWCRKGRC